MAPATQMRGTKGETGEQKNQWKAKIPVAVGRASRAPQDARLALWRSPEVVDGQLTSCALGAQEETSRAGSEKYAFPPPPPFDIFLFSRILPDIEYSISQ